ncbi:MAG TPA: FAD-dependent monooxygenase [Longimicrobium sp.]|nr:FAD-dependent monooxygenase [Longimicrobium sp.]
MEPDVLIVGGGIGGLAAAIALRQRGFAPRLYEAAPELREVGAGIWVPPNAMQVLARLGLDDSVAREGAPVRTAELRDAKAGVLQRADLSHTQREFGHPTVAIHRGRLQRVLADAAGSDIIQTGAQCTGVEQRGERVAVRFADGGETEADVVIGADGLRSAVRESIFPGVRMRYSGQTSYRGTLAYTLPPELDGTGWEVWSAGARVGFSAIGHGEVYWYATQDAPAGGSDAPETLRGKLDALAAAFPAPIPALIAATEVAHVTRTDIGDFAPTERWHRGRVVLLGDAAHATTPNLGQGGAQAIEDAWVLADRLAASASPEAAFAEYERIRMPKARMVVNTSWRFGKMTHLSNPLARGARNLLLRLTPASVGRRQTDALYRLNY